jgi:ferritin-like metal-binding protein YciE
MKLMMEKLQNLQDLYVYELRFLLSAEEMIAPKSLFLVEMATDDALKQILDKHWQDSEKQAARLRDILSRVTTEPNPIKCTTVYSLFDEAEDLIQNATHEFVRNTAILAVARRIKHYELAFYETLFQLARALGRNDDARLLEDSMNEEIGVDQQLARLADRMNTTAQAA